MAKFGNIVSNMSIANKHKQVIGIAKRNSMLEASSSGAVKLRAIDTKAAAASAVFTFP